MQISFIQGPAVFLDQPPDLLAVFQGADAARSSSISVGIVPSQLETGP